MRDLAKLGFALLGCYLILAPLGHVTSSLPLISISDISPSYLITVVWWAIFALAPGAFLIFRSGHLGRLLFPELP